MIMVMALAAIASAQMADDTAGRSEPTDDTTGRPDTMTGDGNDGCIAVGGRCQTANGENGSCQARGTGFYCETTTTNTNTNDLPTTDTRTSGKKKEI